MVRKTERRKRFVMSAPDRFQNAVKLVALLQLSLEQMDTIKGTKIYRHKIKNQINSLERSLESLLSGPVNELDERNEDLFNTIQENISMVLDMSLEELSMLKVAVEESRE
jgi:hypothetical protein